MYSISNHLWYWPQDTWYFRRFPRPFPPEYRKHGSFNPFPSYLHHIAFGRLKSHTQFNCPASQLIYIFLKFQCVLCILNFSLTTTVIRKESYFRINVCWDFINVQSKQQGTVPCGTPDKNGTQRDFAPFTIKKNLSISRVCNHVIAVYSENKLQHYATAYRNHKSAGEKLCLVSNLYFSSKPG